MTGAKLPNLLIVGVEKAGTTSLFSYLAQHPDICASSVKEIDFFRNLRGYSDERPPDNEYNRYFDHCGHQKYLLEASPSYCFLGRPVIAAIKQTLGRPQVIISLRDPAERMWSMYTWRKSKGRLRTTESFEQFIDACQQQHEEETSPDAGPRLIALSVGFYQNYVIDWLDEFGDDVYVVFAEELFRDPVAVVARLCQWLGVDHEAVSSFRYDVRNKTAHARSSRIAQMAYALRPRTAEILRRQPAFRATLRRVYTRLNTTSELDEVFSPQTRDRLEAIYRVSNAALARRLAKAGYEDLPEWLRRV